MCPPLPPDLVADDKRSVSLPCWKVAALDPVAARSSITMSFDIVGVHELLLVVVVVEATPSVPVHLVSS